MANIKNTVQLAVVGCGSMAQGVHLPNILRHPKASLRWCCDINPEKLEEVRLKFAPQNVTQNFEDVIADSEVDGIILSTPHQVRLGYIRIAANAGNAIYVEKPIASNVGELKEIQRIVQSTGVILVTGHNRRLAPAIIDAKKILNQHRKNPVSAEWRIDRNSHLRDKLPEERQCMVLIRINDDILSWMPWAFPDGIMISELTHFSDLACYLIGSHPTEVYAQGNKIANNIIIIRFEDGSLACIFTASVGSMGYPKELVEIYCEGSAIIIDHLIELRVVGIPSEPFRRFYTPVSDAYPELSFNGGILDYYHKSSLAQSQNKGFSAVQVDKGHYALFDQFINCIIGGAKNPCPIDETAMATAIIFKAMESLDKERSIPITPEDYLT